MIHPTGITLAILRAAIEAHDAAPGRVDEEDVRAQLDVNYPAAVVRDVLRDLGADWLNVLPHHRDGKLTRVEVLSVVHRPDEV